MATEPELAFSTHADPMDRQAPPPGIGVRSWLRWLWSRLTSMRTALILLLLLGIAAIPGSLVPQRTSDPLAVNQFVADNPELSQWYERFGLFDVFGSPWFSAIYLLLFLSLLGCLIPRARQHYRMWQRSPGPPPSNLSRLPDSHLVAASDVAATLDEGEQVLRKQRWRVRRSPDWVAGEKGIWRENGNQIFHFSLLGVLAAVGLGALGGWQGNVVLTEGGGFSNTLTQYDTFTGGRFANVDDLPPFSLQLQDFAVDFERDEAQRGEPRDFRAEVLISPAPGEPAQQQVFGVNDPIEIDGVKIFLIGHGYAPSIVVRDGDGEVVFDDSVVFIPQDGNFTSAGVIKVPDSEPQLGFRGLFLPTAVIDQEAGPDRAARNAARRNLAATGWCRFGGVRGLRTLDFGEGSARPRRSVGAAVRRDGDRGDVVVAVRPPTSGLAGAQRGCRYRWRCSPRRGFRGCRRSRGHCCRDRHRHPG